jgi:hypothetical protein
MVLIEYERETLGALRSQMGRSVFHGPALPPILSELDGIEATS